MTMNGDEVHEAIQKIWKKSGWSKDNDGDDAFLAEAKWAVLEGTEKLKICYHGTDEESAKLILEEGFRVGTYFSEHLESALGYGGPYIFEVCFTQDTTSSCGWQFTIGETVPPDRIVRCKLIETLEVLHENEALGKKILRSNLSDKGKKEFDEDEREENE